MKFVLLAALPMLAAVLASNLFAADPAKDSKVYEMRIYYANEGKLDALHARFRDHTLKLFAKHGMTNVGYWVPVGDNAERKLVYVLAYPSKEAREASWKAFVADPVWKDAKAASEKDGVLVGKVETLFMSTTDYSPNALETTSGGRVFELRTYTTTPNNLLALDSRFRDHTIKLFAKHGMTNLIYWHLASGQPNVANTLVYLLGHKSVDAAKESFDNFRKDPDWLTARKASEEKAGGSLTVENGVKSEFLKPTDYSPLK